MARLLIIDDESNIRRMLQLALAHAGHTVETASDGFEGLERFGDGAGWDLVLLDHRMPGMEGIEVLRQMHARRPGARVVMITAFGTIDLAAEALASGANDFLRKPFTIETLRSAVDTALADQPHSPQVASAAPVPSLTFERAGINGFRLESVPGVDTLADGGFAKVFSVQQVAGIGRACRVEISASVAESVRAQAGTDTLPGGDGFWEALCGEALANWLWQNATLPPGGALRVDDLSGGLRRWIDAVVGAAG